MNKNIAMMVTFLGLIGCASQPTKAPIEVKNEIQSGDFGVELTDETFARIQNDVVQGILNNIRRSMVDPDSTKMTGIQMNDFKKCVLNPILPGLPSPDANSPKGYCVAFSYNSRNRMGGYGGSQPSVALVKLEADGRLVLHTPTSALAKSEQYRYPYTHETGVYSLTFGF
jgi:hypothetical protein